jgi:hypothetical protein
MYSTQRTNKIINTKNEGSRFIARLVIKRKEKEE